ncbi:MAG: DUF692 domain-containing protein [Pseudomonadota bacterium]
MKEIADTSSLPKLGLGLGLRNVHFDHIEKTWPEVDWFEAISENFMDSRGRPRALIRKVADRYPVVLHGVSMSIGSTDPLNLDYLSKLRDLAQEVQPAWISDHLCWTGVMGLNSHDLLPVPLNEETLNHIAARVHKVQEFLGRPLILENPSSYVEFHSTTMQEPEFLGALAASTGCGLLLDVNNVYVTCFNSDADPRKYLEHFPMENVVQMHLAGHTDYGTHIIDTHDQPVRPEVWQLYAHAYQSTGGASTLLEWDGNIPSFEECQTELHKAENYMAGPFKENLSNETYTQVQVQNENAVSNPVNFLVPEVMGVAAPVASSK